MLSIISLQNSIFTIFDCYFVELDVLIFRFQPSHFLTSPRVVIRKNLVISPLRLTLPCPPICSNQAVVVKCVMLRLSSFPVDVMTFLVVVRYKRDIRLFGLKLIYLTLRQPAVKMSQTAAYPLEARRGRPIGIASYGGSCTVVVVR